MNDEDFKRSFSCFNELKYNMPGKDQWKNSKQKNISLAGVSIIIINSYDRGTLDYAGNFSFITSEKDRVL